MKARTAVIIGLSVILVGGIVILLGRLRAASREARVTGTMERIRQVNISRPERQTQAKMLMMASFMQNKIPEAAHWCETLNAGGKIWPITPTNTVFALNAKMAGQTISRAISGDTVVFFETQTPGWNQSGDAGLLASNPDGVAVVFADGRSLMVSPAEAKHLRWTP